MKKYVKLLVLIGVLSCVTLTACGSAGAQAKEAPETQGAEAKPIADIPAEETAADGQTTEDSQTPANDQAAPDGQTSETGGQQEGGSEDTGEEAGASEEMYGVVIKVEKDSVTVNRVHTTADGSFMTAAVNLEDPDEVVVSFSDDTVFTVEVLEESGEWSNLKETRPGTAADLKADSIIFVKGSFQGDVLVADSIVITEFLQ